MSKQPHSSPINLRQAAVIAVPVLARLSGVGNVAIRSAAARAGVRPQRSGNGRDMLSFEQAEAIVTELNKRTTACGA